jgi:UDP-N-acetylmuramate--alanine ligase
MTHIHMIGIGGTGLSAIAKVLLENGYRVSGSDMCDSKFVQAVREAGAKVTIGHTVDNILGADLIVRSSAIPDSNIEVQQALKAGIPVLKRSDFLGQIMNDKQGIAVAGTHGKTTTSAMLAWVLYALKQDPSFIVGGVVNNLKTNARSGKGTAFIIEADEYDRMFLGLKPQIALITNVEYDHPDIYSSREDFVEAFRDFINCIRPDGELILCQDDQGAMDLLPTAQASGVGYKTYGISKLDADYRAVNLVPIAGQGYKFDLAIKNKNKKISIQLQEPGKHNILNALGTIAVADQIGLPLKKVAEALSEFSGTERRFDVLGEVGGVVVINDYAHHPTEIRATITAAKERYPGQNIWVVWQPHTYTRTQVFFDAFIESLKNADHVVIPEVFRSREPFDPEFSSQKIVQAMPKHEAYYVPDLMDIPDFLKGRLKSGDVLMVLSAGDADRVSRIVYENLRNLS